MDALFFHQRRAGILLHPTSLPSQTLDRDVERWLEVLKSTGFSIWQVLPLGEPQHGLSPYQCVSAFALNPALLSTYEAVEPKNEGFINYCREQDWLNDYALFKVLKIKYCDTPWYEWPDEYKYRRPHAMLNFDEDYLDQITEVNWQQYQLHLRWLAIRKHANANDILLFGDVPLFVAHDSAEVWASPERFQLDEAGHLKTVAGVPPDYYSETGQRWGNPHYNWDFMRHENYSWWVSRIKNHLEYFDLLRIDHFRGLESSWVINASCDTAIDGHWQKVPGDEMLRVVENALGDLPIVAEDLGIITDEVTKLRKHFKLPGMSVMQFGFDGQEDNPHRFQNIAEDQVVYTGTHDNDTLLGWFLSLDDESKQYVYTSLELSHENVQPGEVVDCLMKQAMDSDACICILPLQDFLLLDSDARMNVPGTIEGNWNWSYSWDQLDTKRVEKMKTFIDSTNRFVNIDD